MKCPVCNYEQGYEWSDNDYKEKNPSGEKFIKMNGYYTITEGEYGQHVQEVYLYACPKCNVVRMVKNF